jgi:hypothetical protein
MTYDGRVLALTRHFAKLSISPESSDGFASVGTILPKEEGTPFSGRPLRVCRHAGEVTKVVGGWRLRAGYRVWLPIDEASGECNSIPRRRALAMVGILVIGAFVVMLVAPCLVAASIDLDEEDAN